MGAWEEKVVDRGIDQAWREFRIGLAEHLEGLAHDAEVVLTPSAPDDVDAPYVRITRSFRALTVSMVAAGEIEPPFRPDHAARDQLHGLGFRIRAGEPTLRVGPRLIDQAAHGAAFVLRDVWGVVHPSFVDTGDWERPVSHPEAESSAPPEVPAVVTLHTADDLARWVDLVLTPEFGHAPHKDEHGQISVTGRPGERVTITVRDDGHRVEIWTVLAEEVRFKAAHREIDRLSRRHGDVRFFLCRDDLVASVSIATRPFAPEQVIHALRRMLRLSGKLNHLEVELQRRRKARAAEAQPDELLMAIFSAAWTKDVDLGALVFELSNGSADVVEQWYRLARTKLSAARKERDAATTESVRSALERTVRKWTAVYRTTGKMRHEMRDEHRSTS